MVEDHPANNKIIELLSQMRKSPGRVVECTRAADAVVRILCNTLVFIAGPITGHFGRRQGKTEYLHVSIRCCSAILS